MAERLETFHDVFAEHLNAITPAESEVESRQVLRKRFWTELLERASGKTDLHSGISPGTQNWVGTGAGTSGLAYNYVVTKNAASIELYIDRGKASKAENKRLFDILLDKKEEIEATFGGKLDWQRLDSKRACESHRT